MVNVAREGEDEMKEKERTSTSEEWKRDEGVELGQVVVMS